MLLWNILTAALTLGLCLAPDGKPRNTFGILLVSWLLLSLGLHMLGGPAID